MKTNELSCKDLMIGDWVYNKYRQRKFRVYNVLDACIGEKHDDGMIEGHKPQYLEPIQLTPKILEKNGFESREYTDNTEYVFYDGYEVNINFDEGLPEEDIPPSIFLNIDFAEKSVVMPIEHVHQLQQAMRLMGCDKEIEL